MEQYLDTWSRSRNHEVDAPDTDAVSFALTPAGSVSGLDPTTLALMIDISHWQGDVDIQRMVTEGGIAMCFPKACDGKQVRVGDSTQVKYYIDDTLYVNVQKCYDANIPCAPYIYVQPAIDNYTLKGVIDWHWEVIQGAYGPLTPLVSYHAIMLDFEEATANNTNGRDVIMGLIKLIRAHPKFGQVPVILYSSNYILTIYPALKDEIANHDDDFNLLLAQWVLNTVTTCTWDELKDKFKTINMKVITPKSNWFGVQFSSAFILPGGKGRTDLIFYHGTKEKLYAWLKFTPKTTPPVEPEPEPDTTELRQAIDALKTEIKELTTAFEQHTHTTNIPIGG
jgi:GH25 family lysozyme M1 (1,4-beta-N-acetylmuramidase)